MDLKNILAISGKPGLYRMVSSNTARLVVESIHDKKKLPVPATSKVSSLDDIAIFTIEEEVPLRDVFSKIYEKTNQAPALSHKSTPAERRGFISEVLSDLDHERVYDSDLKKLFNWYNILFQDGFFAESSDSAVSDAVVVEEVTDEPKED